MSTGIVRGVRSNHRGRSFRSTIPDLVIWLAIWWILGGVGIEIEPETRLKIISTQIAGSLPQEDTMT